MGQEATNKTLEEKAKRYIDNERGMPHDSFNSVAAIQLNIDDQEAWGLIKKARTYEEYLLRVLSNEPELAQTILRKSNADLVKKYNHTVAEINVVIGGGVKTQAQADALKVLLANFRDVVYGD